MICYADSHYICLFKKIINDETFWVNYNDTIIFKLNKFKDVIINCLKMRFHPIMLFYTFAKDGDVLFDAGAINKEDTDRILSFCHSFDENNENTYKRDELRMSRLRPSIEIKKKPDEAIKKFMNRKVNLNSEEDDEDYDENLEGLGVYLESQGNNKEKKKKKPKVVKQGSIRKDDALKDKDTNFLSENKETKEDEKIVIDFQKSIDFSNNKPEEVKLKNELIETNIKISVDKQGIISDEDWICPKCKNMNNINDSYCISIFIILSNKLSLSFNLLTILI